MAPVSADKVKGTPTSPEVVKLEDLNDDPAAKSPLTKLAASGRVCRGSTVSSLVDRLKLNRTDPGEIMPVPLMWLLTITGVLPKYNSIVVQPRWTMVFTAGTVLMVICELILLIIYNSGLDGIVSFCCGILWAAVVPVFLSRAHGWMRDHLPEAVSGIITLGNHRRWLWIATLYCLTLFGAQFALMVLQAIAHTEGCTIAGIPATACAVLSAFWGIGAALWLMVLWLGLTLCVLVSPILRGSFDNIADAMATTATDTGKLTNAYVSGLKVIADYNASFEFQSAFMILIECAWFFLYVLGGNTALSAITGIHLLVMFSALSCPSIALERVKDGVQWLEPAGAEPNLAGKAWAAYQRLELEFRVKRSVGGVTFYDVCFTRNFVATTAWNLVGVVVFIIPLLKAAGKISDEE